MRGEGIMAKENCSSPAASILAFRPPASRRQHGPAAAGGGEPPQPRQPSPGRRPAPLDANPFSGLPDPGYLYTNGELRALYNKLLASIGARGGLFLLTGEGGTGKTALLTRLAEEMRAAGYRVMTAVPADRAFRVPAGRPTVLLVDGADDLDDAAIGRLASLLRASGGAGSEPLRLVLSGRPSLAARLLSRKFAALKSALVLHCRLHRLSDPDIAQLIWHRLRRAGHRGPGLFPEEAIAEIARLAHGLPGRALLLGTRAIALAEAAGGLIVFVEFVRQAADALAPRDGDPAAAAAVPARAARSRARRIGTALGGLVASSAAAAALFVYAVPDESRASIGYTIVSTIKERLPAAVDAYLADRQQQASGPGGEARAPGPSSAASAIAAGMITFAQWTTPSDSGPAKTVSPLPPLPADATGSSVDDDYDDDGDAPGAGGSAPVPVRPEPSPSDSVAQPIAADIPAPAVPAAIADEPGRPPDHADDAAPAAADAAATTPPAADAAVSEGPSTAPPSQHDETRRDEPQGDEPQAGAAQAGEQRDGSVAAPGRSTAPADGSAEPPHDADAATAGKTAPAPMPSAAGTPQPPPSDAAQGSGDGAAASGTTAAAPPAVTQPVPPAQASPPPSRPAVAREPSPAGGNTGAAKDEAVSKETIELLIRRGDTMLATGDISAARLLYERAAAAGNARAATAAGKTYDPIFLQQIGALGVTPRPERAIRWYRQAIDAGDAEAEARMVRLQALGSR